MRSFRAIAVRWVGRSFAVGCALVPINFEDLRAALADRYALEREIGRGATAVVFLAQELNPRRRVALKVLDPDRALAAQQQKFIDEIDTVSNLGHPHIQAVLSAGVVYGPVSGQEYHYYSSQYVAEGSLADRLEREGPLPVADALRLAAEVADALAAAHAAGVIHCDVKPHNILLPPGHACLADFGICRVAVVEDTYVTVTETGVEGPCTPAYASPEQARGRKIDARSDAYSLGCVLFEMLTGETPYRGPPQAQLAQRLTDPARSVRTIRRVIPPGVARIVARALAIECTDRFQTAAALRDALRRGSIPPAPRARTVVVAAAAVAVVTGVWARDSWWPSRLSGSDSTTYAVVSVQAPDSVVAKRVGATLHDALAQWNGLRVVEDQRVREQSGSLAVTTPAALSTARRLRAGRYVRVEITPLADSFRVHVALHDALQRGRLLREQQMRVDAALTQLDARAPGLVDALLFPDSAGRGRTRSFLARTALGLGLAAVRQWDIARADSAFRDAVHADEGFAYSHLWLAQTRFWGGIDRARWQSSAERAFAGGTSLSAYDRATAEALVMLARGNVSRACEMFDALSRQEPFHFSGWYGLARCLTRDDGVIADAASSSGWRFRSSYHHALQAYHRAFQLHPAIHRSLRRSGYFQARQLFWTGGGAVRRGRGLGTDSVVFEARPTWIGDSLVFVPYPRGANVPAPDRRHALALRKLRLLFHEVAAAWVAASPNDASALEALSVSLEMLGDPSCRDTLRRARALALFPEERLRLAATEVWMQVKLAMPLDIAGIRTARALADSLLKAQPPPGADNRLLASIAILTGRIHLAAALNERASVEWQAPPPIARSAARLLVYASVGGPADSLESLEERVVSAADRALAPDVRRDARLEWLARPATLAFDHHRMRILGELRGQGDALLDAQGALLASDTVAVLRYFEVLRQRRKYYSPEALTLDGLYPESALLAATGRKAQALEWLEPTLTSLAGGAPLTFHDPARAGALMQALVLRAELAVHLGDRRAAARWARLVAMLWSNADAFLMPTVERMRQLAQ